MAHGEVPFAPPRNVEYTNPDPLAFNLVTNGSEGVLNVVLNAPGVVGKSADAVDPVTYAFPALSMAMAPAKSIPLPPRNVEYTRVEPVASSFVTKTSGANRGGPRLCDRSTARGVVEKPVDSAPPVTSAGPAASTAMALARLLPPLPPRKVEYRSMEPV